MMRRRISTVVLACAVFASACKHEPFPQNAGYPLDIAEIIVDKCATSGCHNEASYVAAGGLDLSSWDKMFEGSRSGAAVIPYSPDFSTLCYFTNTDTSIGVALLPTMPLNAPPLSAAEYVRLKTWIEAGAADDKGNIKFAGDQAREKLYITNRGCNVVTVVDKESLLPMRYVTVGIGSANFPYCVKVSPDKKHWYVSFFSPTNIIRKFSAGKDEPVGEINIGTGTWTSFAISADSKYGFFVDNSSPGKMAYVDLEVMQLLATYTFNGNFRYPSGIVINDNLKKLYVGATYGNFIYKIDIANPLLPSISEMVIDGSSNIQYQSLLDPQELILENGKDECYVACAGSGEIRRISMQNDNVWQAIPLGAAPAHMDISASKGKLFASCPDDIATFPGNRGSVTVVDLATGSIEKRINSGYQPYGICVDDKRGMVTVVNANISSAGPKSHHSSRCGERNGNISFIRLSDLSLMDKKRELSIFPFSISAR
ncbi:MAG TPA: c-type cytochrome domain-containing protein [Flavipsychrobacter sp.]|nr:c-type cytochrome domain-containing protein [Flavipsychrobacter sp.]